MESELLASGEQLKLMIEGRPAVVPAAQLRQEPVAGNEDALSLGVPAQAEG